MSKDWWEQGPFSTSAVMWMLAGKASDPPKPKPVYYAGAPEACDICRKPFGQMMYDGRTTSGWANMCQRCFARHGYGLGTGKGQRYSKQEDGRWLKTGG